MKKVYLSLGMLIAALVFMLPDALAQRTVNVTPGIGTLNDAINGDTTETGDRIDMNTVYLLERGEEAYYGLKGTIENSGFPLTIEAAEGDGPRPILQPRDEGDGSSPAFRARDNVTLKGLHVTNLDQLGGLNDRILRCSADSMILTVDDCWFDKASQSFIRCDNPGMIIKITNTVVSNIGLPKDPANGRGIDDRGNMIDTIIIENSTFYNVTQRIIRDGGDVINYCKINNSTFMNVGTNGFTFGPVGELVLTNNMFENFGFVPTDIFTPATVFSIDSVGDVPPVITATNNNVYLDSTLVAPYLNDTLMMPIIANSTFLTYLLMSGNIATMLNEPVEFNDAPPFAESFVSAYVNNDLENAPDWEEPAIPGGGGYHLDVPYDFGWVHSKLFVAATDGQQLGDRNWEADRDVMGVVHFENPRDLIFYHQFANAGDDPANMSITFNPDMAGINNSIFALKLMVQDGADPWAGFYSDAVGYINITEEMHHMTMMVHKDVISDCAIKLEQGTIAGPEVHVANTLTGEWELVTFDMSDAIGGTFTRLTIFPDFPNPRTVGSTSYVDNIMVITSPVSVKQQEANKIMIYPNPVTDQLNVDYPSMHRILVRDILGKAVRSVDLQGEDHYTFEVSDLVEGVYFISVEAETGTMTNKFLKK